MPSYLLNTEGYDLSTSNNVIAQGFNAEIPVSEIQLQGRDYDIRAMCINQNLNTGGTWWKTQTGNKLPFLIQFTAGSAYIDITTAGANWRLVPPFLAGVPDEKWKDYKRVYLIAKTNPGGVTQVFEIDDIFDTGLGGGDYVDITGTTISGGAPERRLIALRPATATSANPTEGYLLWSKENVLENGPVFAPENDSCIFPLWNPGKGFLPISSFRFNPQKWGGNKFYISQWNIYDWGTNTGLSAGMRDIASNYATSQGGTVKQHCGFDDASELISKLNTLLARAGWNVSSTVTSIPDADALNALSHSNIDIILYYNSYTTNELNDYDTTAVQYTIYEPSTTTATDRYHISTSTDPVFGQITIKADMSNVFRGIWNAPLVSITGSSSFNHADGNPMVRLTVPVGMYIQDGDYVEITGCSNASLNGTHMIQEVATNPATVGITSFTINVSYSGGITSEALGIDPNKRVNFKGGNILGGSITVTPGAYSGYSVSAAGSVAGTNTDTINVYQETGVRVETTSTTTTIPDNSTEVNGIYLSDSTSLEAEEYEIFIKYTLYDGSDALIARKLVEMGVPVSPDNVKWFRNNMDLPDEDYFEMELDEVEFNAYEYLPDMDEDVLGYHYDDERQG